MKRFLLCAAFLFCIADSFSQENSKTTDTLFAVMYTTGENWDTTRLFHEQKYFKEHSSHLAQLRKSGKVRLGGRFSDTGMLIIQAASEAEAKELITTDESIKHRLFKAEIFLFDPFYAGCIE